MRIRLLAVVLSLASTAVADQEAYPTAYVAAGGGWYAKCVPSNPAGAREAGTTTIYRVGQDADTLVYTFDWYSPKIYITGWGGGVSIVRMGPWPRGYRASESDLAIAFYRDGRLVRRYSTLDLAGDTHHVQVSVSHYTVIKEVTGFVHLYEKSGDDTVTSDPDYGFEVVLNGGRRMVFDLRTGEQIPTGANQLTRPVK